MVMKYLVVILALTIYEGLATNDDDDCDGDCRFALMCAAAVCEGGDGTRFPDSDDICNSENLPETYVTQAKNEDVQSSMHFVIKSQENEFFPVITPTVTELTERGYDFTTIPQYCEWLINNNLGTCRNLSLLRCPYEIFIQNTPQFELHKCIYHFHDEESQTTSIFETYFSWSDMSGNGNSVCNCQVVLHLARLAEIFHTIQESRSSAKISTDTQNSIFRNLLSSTCLSERPLPEWSHSQWNGFYSATKYTTPDNKHHYLQNEKLHSIANNANNLLLAVEVISKLITKGVVGPLSKQSIDDILYFLQVTEDVILWKDVTGIMRTFNPVIPTLRDVQEMFLNIFYSKTEKTKEGLPKRNEIQFNRNETPKVVKSVMQFYRKRYQKKPVGI